MRTIALLYLSLCAVGALAQSANGTIAGTITDAQQARVPAVRVTALHVPTNRVYTGVSGGDGTYVIPALPVGAFKVTAAIQGFATFERTGIVLEVGQRLRLDIVLTMGQVAETITVSGTVSRVQTEDSSLGTLVETKRIEELPLNGRYVFNLVRLAAGVHVQSKATDGFADTDNGALSNLSINGGPIRSNQFVMDGAVNGNALMNEINVVPMLDSVAEFKVVTNDMRAEFGQSSGGVINMVTKSGTNEFHGTLYEFVRNDSMDARNAFATQADSRTGRIKPILRYNQYGGTLGGPVEIPKVYSGRNRTFFFFGYEQWRHVTSNINQSTVPTPAQRTGDFTSTFDGLGRLIPIYDPATTRPNPAGGWMRDLMPGNVVPRSRQDTLSLKVLEYLPLPNAVPNNPYTNSLNYLSLQSYPTVQGVTDLKIDQRFSASDSMFGRYTGSRNTKNNRVWGLGDADTGARDDQRDNHNWTVGETHIFSPNTLNEFRVGLARQWLLFNQPSFGKDWPAKLGFPSIFPQDCFPGVSIEGALSIGAASGTSAGWRPQHVVQVTDSVTMIRGAHTIKLGTDQRWNRGNWGNRLNPSGLFSFSSSMTGNPQAPAGTGYGLATYLLGAVTGGSQSVRPFWAFHSWSNGSYIQDDWKITRRLTLNLGLRYDLPSGVVERWNQSSSFAPFEMNPETNMPGALLYAGVTKDRHFAQANKTNFGPRFGFAWDPFGDGKTAVRGGYAVIFSPIEPGDSDHGNPNSLGFSTDTPFVATGGPFPAFQFSVGPSYPLNKALGAAGGPSAFRGQNVRYQPYKQSSPYLQQWNFTLQRQFPGHWLVTAAYAGSRGVHLFGGNYNLNQLDPKYWELGLSLQNQVPNPFYGQIRSGALSGATIARSQTLVPYPDYLAVSTAGVRGASSSYHSFQFTAERSFANGLTAHVAYTNGKLITDSYSANIGSQDTGDFRIGRFNRQLDRSVDETDVAQHLIISALYELPVGRNKRFLNIANPIANGVIGGWQVNVLANLQSGDALAVRGASNFTGINWPDMVGDPTLPESDRNAVRWFNTDAFRNPANWTIGNVGRLLPSTRGPGMTNIDLSLFKNFKVTEKARLEFRGEAFNVVNTVNLGNPGLTFTPNAAGVNTNPNFGRINSSLAARRIQLGLRLAF
ncbi:MAG TPA: TonB-dependent receptor [Bryobacteraceae bacterium]|nr:TonB-dependent receptor [Bryobacteraceae bacterium]